MVGVMIKTALKSMGKKNQRNAQKNYSIFLWSELIQIHDNISFDFQNLQYLISLLA